MMVRWAKVVLAVLTCSVFAIDAAGSKAGDEGRDSVASSKAVSEVLQRYSAELMAIPGVVGTGEGRHKGKPCVILFVEKKSAALTRKIPTKLDGFAVVIKEVGKVKPLKR